MSELVDLGRKHARRSGVTQTPIPQLQLIRYDARSERIQSLHKPSFCLVAQGSKEVTVAAQVLRYGVGEFLISTVELPITGEVNVAPYLCFAVSIETATVYDVLREVTEEIPSLPRGAIGVGRSNAALDDALLRLVRCLDHADDRAVVAPGVVRELVYRLLQTRFGGIVREIGLAGSPAQRIARAIEQLKNGYADALRVEALARDVGMSTSSFHEHFKRVTSLSPLQFQKQLRLHEARRLLRSDGLGAAETAFRVGYQSAAQFSREYARFFGAPPMQDTRS